MSKKMEQVIKSILNDIIGAENAKKTLDIIANYGFSISDSGNFVKDDQSLDFKGMIDFIVATKETEFKDKLFAENGLKRNAKKMIERLDGKSVEVEDLELASKLLRQANESIINTVIQFAKTQNIRYENESFISNITDQEQNESLLKLVTLLEKPNNDWELYEEADKYEELDKITPEEKPNLEIKSVFSEKYALQCLEFGKRLMECPPISPSKSPSLFIYTNDAGAKGYIPPYNKENQKNYYDPAFITNDYQNTVFCARWVDAVKKGLSADNLPINEKNLQKAMIDSLKVMNIIATGTLEAFNSPDAFDRLGVGDLKSDQIIAEIFLNDMVALDALGSIACQSQGQKDRFSAKKLPDGTYDVSAYKPEPEIVNSKPWKVSDLKEEFEIGEK